MIENAKLTSPDIAKALLQNYYILLLGFLDTVRNNHYTLNLSLDKTNLNQIFNIKKDLIKYIQTRRHGRFADHLLYPEVSCTLWSKHELIFQFLS